MNRYRDFLGAEGHNAVNKWSHYPEIYDDVFHPYRENCKAILEIGVQNGGSLQMLHHMFPNAKVYGLDIDPRCAALNGTLGDRVTVVTGDATNMNVLAGLPTFDLIIDDGFHVPQMQAVSFSFLFERKLSPNGVYLVEDLENSYHDWWRKEPRFALGSFFDFVRSRIDDMHRVYTSQESARSNYYSLRLRKIEVYHGIVVFYKCGSLEIPKNQWWEGPRIV